MWKARLLATFPLVLFTTLAFGPGCGGSSGAGLGGDAGGDGLGGGGGIVNSGDAGELTSDAAPPAIGYVAGKVVAPEGTIPIAGALVYLTRAEPAPIPSGVYCDKCVRLDSFSFTYSEPDGTFRLPVHAEGQFFMVTQKGQFRRVRRVTVAKGEQRVNADDTRLPGKTDAANGDTIPKMFVAEANWDSIANSLRKLGVREYTTPPPATFPPTFPPPPGDDTLTNAAKLNGYHIVFVPCSGSTANDIGSGPACTNIYAPDSNGKRVMKDFIQAGGKLYVTDWSYEYVNQTWPGFVQFKSMNGSGIGSACTIGSYSGDAKWEDPSLSSWMSAIGEGNARLEKSYIRIDSTRPQPGLDEEGRSTTITPKVWASTQVDGSSRIATVSFQDRCGRVLYSTYHAEGTDNGGSNTLLAQEKALFHILLEVATCVGVKPEPPR
jgi:hypothetical protein